MKREVIQNARTDAIQDARSNRTPDTNGQRALQFKIDDFRKQWQDGQR